MHTPGPRTSAFAVLFTATLSLALPAQNLGGGAKAPNGEFIKLDLDSWIPGTQSQLAFRDVPTTAQRHFVLVSFGTTSISLPGFAGTLIADPSRGFLLTTGAITPVGTIPQSAAGATLYLQGAVLDSNGTAYFTDATRIDLFNPFVMVGNSRQSSNSIQVFDLPNRTETQKLTNSELGTITFGYDRKWAYVTEPGSVRNRVVAYDLTGPTIVPRAYIALSGGVRYKCAATKSGLRLYVPIHNGVSVIDTDPTSSTFHQEIKVIPVPITGNSGSIFTGPMALALGLAETKLYIAYGEQATYPAATTVGVIDLLQASTPHRAIPVKTGGSFFGLVTRMDIEASPDGNFVYALEWGVQPGTPYTTGYANGGLLSVIRTATDTEVQSIATNGYAAQECAVDRSGRNLYIPQVTAVNRGEILRIDVDNRSSGQFTIRSVISIGPAIYSASASGPLGIDVTPDGSTICFTVGEGTGQPLPEMWTMDARTEKIFGTPVRAESLPGTLSISQY
ncbi:MAG: hypothetical protein H6837_08060 [Planctomycetes bacterium]|nr:hypothetical protein [Planctomycetota bacterium]